MRHHAPATITPLGVRFAPPHPPLPNPSGDTSENPPPFGRRRSHPAASRLRKRFPAVVDRHGHMLEC